MNTTRHKKRITLISLFSAVVITGALSVVIVANKPAQAAPVVGFNAGRIIDDAVFTNKSSMSPAAIQSFLNSKVPVCDTNGQQPSEFGGGTRAQWAASRGYSPPFTCLKDFSENGRSAAQIIYDTAQTYSINPQVLIVLLQKEQGLILDDWPIPGSSQYRTATGYACPDTAACDSQYFGLTKQLDWSGKMFRAILNDSPTWYTPYLLGENHIQYSPNGACGGSVVNIENRSTQALYNYTPYQPNAGALAAGWGQADCGAYGNRNFYLYFVDWFGPTVINEQVRIAQYSAVTDTTGAAARFGISLSTKPTSPVTIHFRFSASAPAKFAGNSYVVIQPDNWNRPELNTIVVVGTTQQAVGLEYYTLMTDEAKSTDRRFAVLTSSITPDIKIANTSGEAPVYRLYNSETKQHAYTANSVEVASLSANGYSNEGPEFYSCGSGERALYSLKKGTKTIYISPSSPEFQTLLNQSFEIIAPLMSTSRGATVPVYRLYNSTTNNHLFTSDFNEYGVAAGLGYKKEGIAFYACAAEQKPVYRMYSGLVGDHLYTVSSLERDRAGAGIYQHEGVAFYTCSANNDSPVFRLYNKSTGNHLYTTSLTERSAVVSTGKYIDEGTSFKLCDTTSTPVFRLYNKQLDNHFYTTGISERDAAQKAGYQYEGAGFYTGI